MNEGLKAEILAELKIELKEEPNLDDQLLEVKVNNAYREVKAARDYPNWYTDAMIEADMAKFYTHIKSIAMYDYAKIGAEGQESYNADGENIKYLDRNKLFSGVLPLVRTLG